MTETTPSPIPEIQLGSSPVEDFAAQVRTALRAKVSPTAFQVYEAILLTAAEAVHAQPMPTPAELQGIGLETQAGLDTQAALAASADLDRAGMLKAMWNLLAVGLITIVVEDDGSPSVRPVASKTAQRRHVRELALRHGLRVPDYARIKL